MTFERKHERLLTLPEFLRRFGRYLLLALAILGAWLLIGIIGYHAIAGLAWIDALLEASMILAGMGPVTPVAATSAKLFASAYAIFSGVVFLSSIGVIFSPILHRILHRFHLDDR